MQFTQIGRLIGFTYFCSNCSNVITGPVWADIFKHPIAYYCEECIKYKPETERSD